jgi:hypothetical protein
VGIAAYLPSTTTLEAAFYSGRFADSFQAECFFVKMQAHLKDAPV